MFNEDKMNFYRYMKKTKNFGRECVVGYNAVIQAHIIFPLDMEKDFATHIKLLADHYHGLTPQPTVLCRTLADPARAACSGPVLIWPRALQWPRMGLPHEFHVVKIIYANCLFF